MPSTKPSFGMRVRVHPKFPEDADWGAMYDASARDCAQGIVQFIREQIRDREYGKIEGLREALRFLSVYFN